jgi:hypothetical protein
MKFLLPLSLLAVLATGPALADCTVPTHSIKVPSAATATKDDMIAVSRELKTWNTEVVDYKSCLDLQQDAAIAALGDNATDDQRNKIAKKYLDLYNNEVDKLTGVANRFNIEVKAFKAKNPPAN